MLRERPACLAVSLRFAVSLRWATIAGHSTFVSFLSQNNDVHTRFREQRLWPFLRSADPRLSEAGVRQCESLRTWASLSQDPVASVVRGAAEMADGRRLKLYSSPMKRCLLTTRAIAAGFGVSDVVVDPAIFEQGGCFHHYPEYADMKGLPEVAEWSREQVDQRLAARPPPKMFPGLREAELLDPSTLSRELDVPVDSVGFVGSVLPGMENGWWAGKETVETRDECVQRATVYAQRLRKIASEDETDVLVIVSHGDFIDSVVKNLLLPPQQTPPAGSSEKGAPSPLAGGDKCCRIVHHNTGMTRIEIDRTSGVAFLVALNQTRHLAPSDLTGGDVLRNNWLTW